MTGKAAVTRRRVQGGYVEVRRLPGGGHSETLIAAKPAQALGYAAAARLKAEREGHPVTGGVRPKRKPQLAKVPAKKRSPAKRPSAREVAEAIRYRLAEERHRERLRRKAARAHPGSEASVDGEPEPDRYTDAEVEALGKEGKAFKKKDGTYSYPVADERDLKNAIQAFGRVRPSEASALKAFIKQRATVMSLDDLLPKTWYTPPLKVKNK